MQFQFTLTSKQGNHHFKVERIYQGPSIEQYAVTLIGKGPILFESNRPYVLATNRKEPIRWVKRNGKVNRELFEVICATIAKRVKKEQSALTLSTATLF